MPTTAPHPDRSSDPRRPLPGWAWALLAVGAVALGGWLGGALDGGARSAAERDPWHVADVGARSDMSRYMVLTEAGERVPLAAAGEPTVVMVSSVSCAVCRSALRDMAARFPAAELRHLRMVTLEGAEGGTAMLRTAGLDGLWHAGPADGAGATLLTFQFPGTPTFLLLDEEGRVRAAMPGYPGRETFEPWLDIITGRSTTL